MYVKFDFFGTDWYFEMIGHFDNFKNFNVRNKLKFVTFKFKWHGK